jgi:hypothetical protein
MNPVIEIRERHSGQVIHRMPLYEFLGALHACTPTADEYRFDDLLILLDGEALTPIVCGHA